MTTEEQDAETARMVRELRDAKVKVGCLEEKLIRFRKQLQAVLGDWDRLSVVNQKSLVVDATIFRPLPTEADIAEAFVQSREHTETVERLSAKLGL